jgi:hypothetical protein
MRRRMAIDGTQEKDFSTAKLDGEHKPNLSKRNVKKKSVQRLSAKHRAEKTHRVKLSSSLRQRRKSIEADICGPISALGQKQIFRSAIAMSTLPPKADIRQCRHVR